MGSASVLLNTKKDNAAVGEVSKWPWLKYVHAKMLQQNSLKSLVKAHSPQRNATSFTKADSDYNFYHSLPSMRSWFSVQGQFAGQLVRGELQCQTACYQNQYSALRTWENCPYNIRKAVVLP